MQRYLVLSGDDFESFRPTGATRCADGGDIWRGGVDSTPNVNPVGAAVGYGAPKRKILTNLYQISRYASTVRFLLCFKVASSNNAMKNRRNYCRPKISRLTVNKRKN